MVRGVTPLLSKLFCIVIVARVGIFHTNENEVRPNGTATPIVDSPALGVASFEKLVAVARRHVRRQAEVSIRGWLLIIPHPVLTPPSFTFKLYR